MSAVGLTSVLAFAAAQTTSTSSSDPVTTDDTGLQTTGYATQSTGNKTAGVRFNVSTVGWHGVSVEWDTRHSNTAARHQQFQYSTDGLNFVDFGAPFVATAGDTWFNNRSIDLSSITAVDNNPNFAFRMVAAFAPSTSAYAASNPSSSYGASGTWRFDMVTVNAAPIPEAETYAMMLAGLGLVGLMAAPAARSERTTPVRKSRTSLLLPPLRLLREPLFCPDFPALAVLCRREAKAAPRATQTARTLAA